jgi:hypothetical protein
MCGLSWSTVFLLHAVTASFSAYHDESATTMRGSGYSLVVFMCDMWLSLVHWVGYRQFYTTASDILIWRVTWHTKLLKLWSYKSTAVHSLQPYDPVPALLFCNWYLQSVHGSKLHPKLTFLFRWRACFIWMNMWTHKITDTKVQKIHILYTELHSTIQKLVSHALLSMTWVTGFLFYVENYVITLGRCCSHFSCNWQTKKYSKDISNRIL